MKESEGNEGRNDGLGREVKERKEGRTEERKEGTKADEES